MLLVLGGEGDYAVFFTFKISDENTLILLPKRGEEGALIKLERVKAE